MGRNRKNRGRGGGHGKHEAVDDTFRSDLLEKSDMHNERFESYYKAQEIIPVEEWDSFMDTLRQPLPTTFRLAGSRLTAQSLNAIIKESHVPKLTNVVFEGQLIPPPVRIPWYPEGLAWQFNVPKKALRKSPQFKKFHSFLVFETEVGNVSRQEAVSMIPPLFLDVEPHHRVMDMCAAPGSKTAQLLEALHAHDTTTSTSIPSGLLIANDSDYKRTHLLIHQSARLPSPALMVTNLDASNYPVINIPSPPNNDSGVGGNGSVDQKQEQLLFDRILCDVPCSGDGTIRKNAGIWKRWQPMDGNGLHSLQLRILQRAMKMLKQDGKIVYSTCSLNPVENEAVIVAALKSNRDFELVDVSVRFPELKRRPGLSKWRPAVDRSISTNYESFEDFVNAFPDKMVSSKMTEGHWPPKGAEDLGLCRCMRIYPHLQDTGGFFVAVLQRKRAILSSAKIDLAEKRREVGQIVDIPEAKRPRLVDDIPNHTNLGSTTNSSRVHSARDIVKFDNDRAGESLRPVSNEKGKSTFSETGGMFKENPYTFLSPSDPILMSCIERLNLTSAFPSSNVVVRNPEGDAVRSLYLANDIVKAVILHNEFNRIRLMAAGTKIFTKQEATKGTDPQFRVLGEGLPVVLPYIDHASIITADISTLKRLVETYYPLCATFSEPFRGIIEARPPGSHIIKIPVGELNDAILTHEIVFPIWKSNVSVTLMIDKKAKSALSLRLFGTDITTAGRDVGQSKKPSDLSPESRTPILNGDEGGGIAIEAAPDIVS